MPYRTTYRACDNLGTILSWAFVLVALLVSPAGWCLERVTLQLKWTHQFQFAGYYAARSQCYYRDAGLEVVIEQGLPGIDVVKRVIRNDAQYGVSSSTLLLNRAGGQPVRVLAVILQHSPLVLIQRGTTGAESIHDIVGKRVMIESDAAEMYAYFSRMGIDPLKINIVDHDFDIQELLDGRVDALTAYVSVEPELLDQRGFGYRIYTPRSAGIDFYGDNLFTSEGEIKHHPERVRAFLAASLKGWHYAVTHVDEMVDLILKEYGGTANREHYLFEARKLIQLMHPELIEIGYMNPGRWRHIVDVYHELGMLPANFDISGFLYENPTEDGIELQRLKGALLAVLFGLAVIGGIAGYIHRVNRRLKQSPESVLTPCVESGSP